MQLTVDIPDELAAALAPGGPNPARAILEAVGLEAYRERRIGRYQLQTLLGFKTRSELDAFLCEHRIDTITAEDFEHDLAIIRHARDSETTNPGA